MTTTYGRYSVQSRHREEGGSEILRNGGGLDHNTEDHNLKLHCRENLKSRTLCISSSQMFSLEQSDVFNI
jgi:hypothetical protein